jgi:hypothetical protein
MNDDCTMMFDVMLLLVDGRIFVGAGTLVGKRIIDDAGVGVFDGIVTSQYAPIYPSLHTHIFVALIVPYTHGIGTSQALPYYPISHLHAFVVHTPCTHGLVVQF